MIGIVAHQARDKQARTLFGTVAADILSMDDGTLGCNKNHLTVWQQMLTSTEQWCVVLEDDALPIPDFRTHLAAALDAAPAPIVSLYLGRHHIPTLDWEQRKCDTILSADDNGAHWIVSNTLLHAVAVAIKRELLPTMLAHLQQLPDFLPIDEAITHWIQNNQHSVAYTWPSLVDHADGPTLFRHHDKLDRPPGRIAYRIGTRKHWNNKAVNL